MQEDQEDIDTQPDQELLSKLKKPRLVRKAIPKPKVVEDLNPAQLKVVSSNLVQQLRLAAEQKYGLKGTYGSLDSLDKFVVGIPMPAVCLEVLFSNSVLPLKSALMIAGPPDTQKSCLAYEIMRWFAELSGIVVHVDTEMKLDPKLLRSVMNVPPGVDTPILGHSADSAEKLQNILTHYSVTFRKLLDGTKAAPGPGDRVPLCMAVDSISMATAEEATEAIVKVGQAGRSHPITQLVMTLFMRAMKNKLFDLPLLLIIIAHLKVTTDSNGIPRKRSVGGEVYNFIQATDIHCSHWKRDLISTTVCGRGIRLAVNKNSFGEQRKIDTRFLWWHERDPETGQERKRHMWDWDWATVRMLVKPPAHLATAVKKAGLEPKTKSPEGVVDCLANLEILGMGKDDYLPFREVGRMITENQEVKSLIREIFGVTMRKTLTKSLSEMEREHINADGE